ncbi:hypothetical protein GOBAR_DD01359 [Gossypium barbadense]|nr:hypothetical protein GOBAR_DD01359 [Gossypium barbadense]
MLELSWLGNLATIWELKQLLVAKNLNVFFLSEKMHFNSLSCIRNISWMEDCLAVRSKERSGDLALLWNVGVDVTVQNYSSHHIDSLISINENKKIRFTGFYGHPDPNSRKRSWDILRKMGSVVRESWVVGGDFNAILHDEEKEGGHRKPRAIMDDFRELNEDVDIKTKNGGYALHGG